MREMARQVVPIISLFLSSYTTTVVCFSIQCGVGGGRNIDLISPLRKSRTETATLGRRYNRPGASSTTTSLKESRDSEDDEIEKLKALAAQLRAEAATLEAERANARVKALEKAFNEFDTDKDGEISVVELKRGLEKALKTELSDERVEALMKAFDDSGDGALQFEEFVGVGVFRNKLEALAREERELAAKADVEARKEAEAAVLAQAVRDLINDRPPTNQEKFLSILPYLFPLMDGLQYGRVLLQQNEQNPFVIGLAVVFALYRNIPFSGFAAFFALNFLSNNPRLNRLIRFNMQQAIFIDIGLFFPGLLTGLYGIILKGTGGEMNTGGLEIFSDVIFVTLLITLAYCSISSLLGIEPNKVPIVSNAATDRMPTIDMFDENGRMIPRSMREQQKKDEEKSDDKKDDDKKGE